jgi:hypothetical protein
LGSGDSNEVDGHTPMVVKVDLYCWFGLKLLVFQVAQDKLILEEVVVKGLGE